MKFFIKQYKITYGFRTVSSSVLGVQLI